VGAWVHFGGCGWREGGCQGSTQQGQLFCFVQEASVTHHGCWQCACSKNLLLCIACLVEYDSYLEFCPLRPMFRCRLKQCK
jgi:hypothetical protein